MVEYSISLPEDELLPSSAQLTKRALAFILDLLIFNLVIYSPFMTAFHASSGITDEVLTIEYVTLNPKVMGAVVGALGASLVLLLTYFALLEYFFGATIGKKFLGIKVMSKEHSLTTFFARNLFKSLLLPILPFDLIGIAFSKSKQRFIDNALGVSVLSIGRIQLISGLT